MIGGKGNRIGIGENQSIIRCADVHCKDPDHLRAADDYLDKIVTAMENAFKTALPIPKVKTESRGSEKKKIPGWNTEVKKYQDDAQFWFLVFSWKTFELPTS